MVTETNETRLVQGVTNGFNLTNGCFSDREIAFRLFLTCWLVYTLHFATNIVREHYLALAIGDHFSFRVDEYAGLHDDIFEKKGYGWHIASNPGVSILGAIPYAIFRPIIDPIVQQVAQRRKDNGRTVPPEYNTPISQDQTFFREAWRRGLDIKFGLAAFIMQSMCMAPSSALGSVIMFYVLRQIFASQSTALWLALLYGFGTPVFFRTGFLNHNLMLEHIAFAGFAAMWNPFKSGRWTANMRFFLGGIAAGTALLFDYSGAVILLILGSYGLASRWVNGTTKDAALRMCWYAPGSLGPIGILWLYQWQSFGHPFYPPQHWMPSVDWSDLGYQGFGWPQVDLLIALAFDYRYGLFVSSPLLLLALVSPFVNRATKTGLPWLELICVFSLFVSVWLFFSCVNYTRWQFNTGIRYMAAIIPFLFLPAAFALTRLPKRAAWAIAVFSVTQSWSLAMYRDVSGGQVELSDAEAGLGVLDPILNVFLGGFKLPALTTLSRMSDQFGDFVAQGTSPLPLFVLTGAIIFVIWIPPRNHVK
ncbi:MAG: DUF2079 domain-containing protein [Deltaproteobacteria bacterium]|nr:DUF2079 domain-containing protein [Deltaproteobacteria bacterium]